MSAAAHELFGDLSPRLPTIRASALRILARPLEPFLLGTRKPEGGTVAPAAAALYASRVARLCSAILRRPRDSSPHHPMDVVSTVLSGDAPVQQLFANFHGLVQQLMKTPPPHTPDSQFFSAILRKVEGRGVEPPEMASVAVCELKLAGYSPTLHLCANVLAATAARPDGGWLCLFTQEFIGFAAINSELMALARRLVPSRTRLLRQHAKIGQTRRLPPPQARAEWDFVLYLLTLAWPRAEQLLFLRQARNLSQRQAEELLEDPVAMWIYASLLAPQLSYINPTNWAKFALFWQNLQGGDGAVDERCAALRALLAAEAERLEQAVAEAAI